MKPSVCLIRMKLPPNVNRIYLSPQELKNETKCENKITSILPKFINSKPAKLKASKIISKPSQVKKIKPKKIKKMSNIPVIASVQSLHPKEIAKKLKKENPPPPLEDPTPENIDSTCEFIEFGNIFCKPCNRIMKPFYYHRHIKSKYHDFLIKFPQFRSEKRQRQQRLSEGKIMARWKIWCEVCSNFFTANIFEHHIVSNKTHQFYLANPDLRPNKVRVKEYRTKLLNTENDLLCGSRKFDWMICDYCRKAFRKKYLLEDHIVTHVDSYKIYDCIFCDEKFFTFLRREKHAKNEHTDANGNFPCKECDKLFTKYRFYVRHCASFNHLKKIENKNGKNEVEKKVKKIIENLTENF